MCVHAMAKTKTKTKKLADKQWKERMQKVCERGIKQISMIDIASIARKQANEQKRQTSKETNKRWCL